MDKKDSVSRREAIAKLAKLSAYSAPSVITLLSASSSHAAGSCPGSVVDQVRVRNQRRDRKRRNMMDADVTINVGDGSRNRLQPNRDSAFDCMI